MTGWSFVKETLQDSGLPQEFVDVTMKCISAARMQVLWNGEALDGFFPSRGIRQGDPISPHIFVLCIERLFQLINVAVQKDLWKPIQISRGGPKSAHLPLLMICSYLLKQVWSRSIT